MDPYRFRNGPEAPPPHTPWRVRAFVKACGLVAWEFEKKLAGAKTQQKQARIFGGG